MLPKFSTHFGSPESPRDAHGALAGRRPSCKLAGVMIKELLRDTLRLKPTARVLRTREGLPFTVHTYGSGPRHVVLAHGFGSGGLSWLPFTLPHARRFTFHAIDLPGHGRSVGATPRAPAGFLDDYASCIEAVVQTLGDEPYLLGGYSIGAYSALNFLARKTTRPPLRYLHMDHPPFPGRAEGWTGHMNEELLSGFDELRRFLDDEKLVVEHQPFDRLPVKVFAKYQRLLSHMSRVSVTDAWAETLSELAHKAPLLGHRVSQRVEWPWAHAIIEAYRTGRFDFREALPDILVPTLLVSGSRNKLFPPAGIEYMATRLPNARLVNFETTNHDLHFRSPVKFMGVLSSFLKGDA